MGKITVYTRQHKNILDILEKEGRFTAKKEFVEKSEEVILMRHAYLWLMKNHPDLKNKPEDADYPVWLSLEKEASMLLTSDSVLLEIEVDESLITKLNVMKWTKINNCLYIEKDAEDLKRHKELLSLYNVNDSKAYLTPFYPEIKREIEKSWERAFSCNYNDHAYGLIWEIKKEWVKNIKAF